MKIKKKHVRALYRFANQAHLWEERLNFDDDEPRLDLYGAIEATQLLLGEID